MRPAVNDLMAVAMMNNVIILIKIEAGDERLDHSGCVRLRGTSSPRQTHLHE